MFATRFFKSRSVYFTGVLLATSLIDARRAYCAAPLPNNNDPLAWLNKAKDAILAQDSKGIEAVVNDASVQVAKVFEGGLPGEIGYGFVVGYCSGLAVKKASKAAAVLIGGTFVGLQFLSYKGFIAIEYEKIQKGVESVLDLNHDGKIDEKDLQLAFNDVNNIVGYHVGTGGGFGVGLAAGLRA